MKAREVRITLRDPAASIPETTGLWLRPRGARAVLAFAHGAGAGMRHAFMEAAAARLADRGIATLRYQFPYMERGRRAPDRAPALIAAVRGGVAEARRRGRGLPVFAAGKSMGGRMTSQACAARSLDGVAGLVFFGFPLHAAGKPSSDRGAHLSDVAVPMLFLQGTRDPLASLARMRPLCRRLGRRATLHVVDGGDHGFHVLKRSGRNDDEALDEIADAVSAWMSGVETR